MMLRMLIATFCCAGTILFSSLAVTSPFKKSTRTQLVEYAEELSKLKETDGANVAAAEIAIAEHWVKKGRMLLDAGKILPAARIAEKLVPELRLIRILVEVGHARDRAEKIEKENDALLTEIKLIKRRLHRLTMEQDARNPSPNPPVGEQIESR